MADRQGMAGRAALRGEERVASRGGASRAAIVRAARACIGAKGISGVAVEDILREAGVSRATLYRQFASLEAIFIHVTVTETQRLLRATIRQIEAEDAPPREKFTALFIALCRQIGSDPFVGYLEESDSASIARTRMIVADPGEFRRLCSPLTRMLARHVQAGALRRDLEAEDMSEWLLRNVWSARTVAPMVGGRRVDLADYAARFIVPPLFDAGPAAPDRAQLADILATVKRIEARLA